jgi:hypothetical protein
MHSCSYGLSTGRPDVKKTKRLRRARKALAQSGGVEILLCSKQRRSPSSRRDGSVVFRFIKGVTL